MTNTDIRQLLNKHHLAVDHIFDTLSKYSIPPAEGEAILLWIAGISAGQCQRPITDTDWIQPAALAWRFGASEES